MPVGDTAPTPASTSLVDHVPAVLRPATAPDGAPGELPDDVESTHLVAERTAVPTAPVGGPTAVLRLWDGRRLTLEGLALVGRNPTTRPGEAEPLHRLTLDDPTRSVSKTHVAIGVDADGVWVTDRGSTNGTVVQGADGSRVECTPDVAVRVPRGATVRLGRYWFTVA